MLPSINTESEPAISVCFTSDWETKTTVDEEYWDFIVELSGRKHVVIVWKGNQHYANFMFETTPKFTMIGVTEESDDQEAVLIPRAMIKSYFKPSFEELTKIISSLSNAASITLLNGPAPKPLFHVQNRISQEPFFIGFAKSLGVEVENLVITSDSLRLELWSVLAELLANYAKTLGTNFIGAPAISRDALGLLSLRYWAPDATHANEKYGMLLIEEIRKLIGKVTN